MSDRDSADELIRQVVEAHGGAKRWERIDALEAELSAWGALFVMKRRPPLRHVRVRGATREPQFVFYDTPRSGLRSELAGAAEVRILDESGKTIESRLDPRAAFKTLKRQFVWDALDFAYFAGYATWNYLMTPFLLLRPGFRFERLEPVSSGGERLDRLKATFPAELPTHCATQTFYFDEHRLLRRLDYTAEVIGGWARAAHLCDEYRDFDGLRIPTRRRVYPLLMGSEPTRFPTLVAIDVHGVRTVASN